MVEQGDMIIIDGIEWPCVVISKNIYNNSGHVIVCPVTKQSDATLGYEIPSGYIQCDNLRMLDLKKRGYSVKGRISMIDLVQVLSRVTAMLALI